MKIETNKAPNLKKIKKKNIYTQFFFFFGTPSIFLFDKKLMQTH